MSKQVTFLCMTGSKSVNAGSKSLKELEWEGFIPREYGYLISYGLKTPNFNIQAKNMYIRVDRPFSEGIEKVHPEDIEDVDIYFNGELIVSVEGWINEEDKSILVTDYTEEISDYYFSKKMWDELVIIRSKKSK